MMSSFHWLIICLITIITPNLPTSAYAHGGIPGVIDLVPPLDSSSDDFWMIDTLGLFRGQVHPENISHINQRSWSWLCDDAVDPMLGVDALLVIDSTTLVAVARSGIYRSIDFGCSFIRLDSPINEHTIGGISAHHSHADEIVVFTNSIGRENRVWWSSDKGETWTRSDLLIAGGIFGMWRDAHQPNRIWVNHAEGLSMSNDGGRTFSTLNDVNYSGASPYEIRLLSGGYINDRLILWASLDHYPTSSLLMSEDSGQTWKEVHNLNDAYDDLAITDNAVWVSTIFSGLFVYPLSELERVNDEAAWSGDWQHHPESRISCLTPDPLDSSALWACGRSDMGWLVGRSTDLGQSWTVYMERYQEASEGIWDCPAESISLNACASRCLDDDCDPSQNQPVSEDIEQSTVEIADMSLELSHEDQAESTLSQDHTVDSNTSTGCEVKQSSRLMSFLLFMIFFQAYNRYRKYLSTV